MDLREFVIPILRGWRLLLVSCLLGLLAATASYAQESPRYLARATLYAPLSSMQTPGGGIYDITYTDNLVESYVNLLSSSTVFQHTAAKDHRVGAAIESVNVWRTPLRALINISVVADSPTAASAFANDLATVGIEFVASMHHSAKSDNRLVLVSPATPPISAFAPSLLKFTTAGIGLGLFIGMQMVFLRAATGACMWESEAVEKMVGAPTLVTLQTSGARRTFVPLRSRSDSPGLEPYRALRLRLPTGGGPRVITIADTVDAERGAGVAADIAAVLAEDGSRTVVVEVSRKPRLATVVDFAEGEPFVRRHLSEYSGVHASVSASSITESRDEAAVSVGSELSVEDVSGVYEALRREFDFIIVDLTAELSGSRRAILMKAADDRLIIVRRGVTRERELAMTVKSLGELKIDLSGIVFAVDPRLA